MMNLKRKIYNPSRKCEKIGPKLEFFKSKQFYICFATNIHLMSPKPLQRSSFAVTKENLKTMRQELKKLGFASMREMTRASALRLDLPPEFPAPGREVLTKSAGRSVGRFVFSENGDSWNVELTLSRPTDLRGGLIIEAYPGKKHSVNGRTYEAALSPALEMDMAVSNIDEFNVFLAGIDDDREISEAVDARKIKKRLNAMGEQLADENSMVGDFLNYMKGFINHCDDLWAWQIQRLRMDRHAQEIMGRLADKV